MARQSEFSRGEHAHNLSFCESRPQKRNRCPEGYRDRDRERESARARARVELPMVRLTNRSNARARRARIEHLQAAQNRCCARLCAFVPTFMRKLGAGMIRVIVCRNAIQNTEIRLNIGLVCRGNLLDGGGGGGGFINNRQLYFTMYL